MSIADVHFAIGKTHDVCQDYGLAHDAGQTGLDGYLAGAVVCDGCSSSPDTDWGARFLARAAVNTWQPFQALSVVQRADHFRQNLELAPEALDATMLLIRETPTGDAKVTVQGDGVVVARFRDGSGYKSWSISFSLNAPDYLSYRLKPARYAAYRAAGGGVKTITMNDGSVYQSWPPMLVNEPQTLVPDLTFDANFSRAEYDVVLVMSDGAESFQKREGTRFVPVPLADVLAQVLDFKTLTHGFIKRRVGRFLTKFCPQNGWQHNDDFAVAGLVLDPPVGSTPTPAA